MGKKYLAPQGPDMKIATIYIKTLKTGRRKKRKPEIFWPFLHWEVGTPLVSKPVPQCVYYRAFSYNFFTRMPEVYWFCSFLFQLIVLWLEFADIELFEWVYEERRRTRNIRWRMTLFDESVVVIKRRLHKYVSLWWNSLCILRNDSNYVHISVPFSTFFFWWSYQSEL